MVHVIDLVESTRKCHTKTFTMSSRKNKQTNKTKQTWRGHCSLGYLFQNVLSLKFPFLNGHWVHFVDLEIFITSRITSVNNKSPKYFLPLPRLCLFCFCIVVFFFSFYFLVLFFFCYLLLLAKCMCGLLTKREVKMAWYWPSSFFASLFMDRDGIEVHKLAKKKNDANIKPSWPNKLGQ